VVLLLDLKTWRQILGERDAAQDGQRLGPATWAYVQSLATEMVTSDLAQGGVEKLDGERAESEAADLCDRFVMEFLLFIPRPERPDRPRRNSGQLSLAFAQAGESVDGASLAGAQRFRRFLVSQLARCRGLQKADREPLVDNLRKRLKKLLALAATDSNHPTYRRQVDSDVWFSLDPGSLEGTPAVQSPAGSTGVVVVHEDGAQDGAWVAATVAEMLAAAARLSERQIVQASLAANCDGRRIVARLYAITTDIERPLFCRIGRRGGYDSRYSAALDQLDDAAPPTKLRKALAYYVSGFRLVIEKVQLDEHGEPGALPSCYSDADLRDLVERARLTFPWFNLGVLTSTLRSVLIAHGRLIVVDVSGGSDPDPLEASMDRQALAIDPCDSRAGQPDEIVASRGRSRMIDDAVRETLANLKPEELTSLGLAMAGLTAAEAAQIHGRSAPMETYWRRRTFAKLRTRLSEAEWRDDDEALCEYAGALLDAITKEESP
jgi:hypothetical protein